MRKNLDRIVWGILLTAFAIFCALVIGIPLAVRSYLFNSTVPITASLEVIAGTVLMRRPPNPEPIGITMNDPTRQNAPVLRHVTIGSVLTTDGSSRAILTFHRKAATGEDFVLCTVQLYNNTQVHIVDGRVPRFSMSPHAPRIALRIDAGQARVATTHIGEERPEIRILTPYGEALLGEGSFSVRVTPTSTDVTVRFGEADMIANGQRVRLASGQRTIIESGAVPLPPLPAAQNLIVNGNFTEPLAPAWQVDWLQASGNATPGKAEIVTSGGRKAVFLSRMGQDGIHTEVGISQVINRDVLDFESLILRLDVKLLYQSLSGGGYLSSEFPLMVRIDFKDIYGIDRFWIRGFYYQNVDNHPIFTDVWGRPFGEQIPHAVWYPYESENLLQALGDIRPARIHSIRIYASGWNYQSMVAEVGLIAE